MDRLSGSARLARYCEAVTSGERSACKWVRLAVQRHLDDLARWSSPDSPYYFDARSADRAIAFLEKLRHIKGPLAKKRLKITCEDWQCFVVGSVFGWKRRDGLRRFRLVYIEVGRKNAKSTISSGVGLYMLFADGEEGAEVYSAATTQKQARIVFDDARRMALKDSRMMASVGLEVMAHNINQLATNSKFEPLSSEGENLDGLNPHCSLVDEVHAHRTREVFDVLESAMGAREQPLLWLITTAGSNRAGICYEQRTHVTKVLQKLDGFEDETTFGIIYTIDEEDDWQDPKAWEKANPNYGVSVIPDDMERACRKAMSMPSALSNFLTKRLNVWVASDSPFYDMQAWQKCHQHGLSIEDFAGQPCWIGMDFAERVDMAAMVAVFRHGEKGFTAFGKYYLPEDTIDASGNSQYRGWVRSGYLTATEGAEIDFQTIYDDLMGWSAKFDIQMVHFDPAYASQFMQQLTKDGVKNAICRPNVMNFSEPMLDHQGAVKSGRFAHDGNPILEWMASNVVAHLDAKSNVYPRKEREQDKIDGIVALLMARNAMMREAPASTFAFFEA